MPIRQPYRPHFHHHLTQNVGDARVGRAAADADHPLAEYGGVDQGVAPHHVRNARTPAHHFGEALVRDDASLHGVMVIRLWSMTLRWRLCRSGMSSGM